MDEWVSKKAKMRTLCQLLLLQKKSVVWHKPICMNISLQRQIHPLVHPDIQHQRQGHLTSSTPWIVCTACGKHQPHQLCCDSTDLLERPTAASVINLVLLCNKSPGSWINCVSSLRPPLYFVLFWVFFRLNFKRFRVGSILACIYTVSCRTGTCLWY